MYHGWRLAAGAGGMLIFFLVLSSSPPPCAADTTDKALAKRFYLLGRDLFVRSDYREALMYFQRSYKLSKRVELLYNIARCHESLGEGQQAIDHYTEFLRSNPDNAALIRARIKNLKKNLPAAELEARTPPPAPESPKAPGPQERSTPWIPWTLAGAGAALLVTGSVLGGLAAAKASDLGEASRRSPPEEFAAHENLESSGQGLATGQIITLAAGGALAAAGLVWLIVHYGSSPERSAESAAWDVAPALSSRGGAISATVRF